MDGTFVDEALRDSRSDFLFEIELKSGKSAVIFVLVKHKSRPDPATPLQLAGYMVRIWLRHAQGRVEGPQEGKARFLTQLLKRRFGPLPDELSARIATASTSQPERWLEVAIDAPTCEAVFRADRAH
ncbi:MAG: Rpn family recombination-promoting nuclease/putative transposase [Alphaproteobacteria bacterium]|nr:Rpn family recombination-promoting nuclease/putative transposase [Alphaproteobacteria bacterium]